MPITETLRQKISDWLIATHRSCPRCNAGPASWLTVSVREGLHPDAAGPKGIDTSMTASIAQLICGNCKFEAQLTLDDVGLA